MSDRVALPRVAEPDDDPWRASVAEVRAWMPTLSRTQVITAVALGLIAVQVAVRAWAVSGGGFFGDDLVFLTRVAEGQDDLGYYFERHNVHFMPLGFALVKLTALAGPYSWATAAAEMVVLQALSGLACWWMLHAVFGTRWRILVPLTFYLFASATVPALMWWASGISVLGAQTSMCLAIGAFVLHSRTRRTRWAAVTVAAVAVGLMFYLKVIVLPLVLALAAVIYRDDVTGLVRRCWQAFRHSWLVWIALAIVGAGYLVLYGREGTDPVTNTSSPDFGASAEAMLYRSLGTALVGGPLRWLSLGESNGPRLVVDPTGPWTTVAWIVVVGLVLYLWSRYHGALRPLALVGTWAAISYVLVTVERASEFGLGVVLDVRYWADMMPVLAFAIGLMLMPSPGFAEALRPRRDPILRLRLPRRAAAALAGAFVVISGISTWQYVAPWHDDFATKRFLANVRTQFALSPERVPMINQIVPEAVLYALAFPTNQTQHLLTPFAGEYSMPDQGVDLKVLDEFGTLTPAGVDRGIVAPRQVGRACQELIEPADEATRIDLGVRTIDFPFWVVVTYTSPSEGRVSVTAGATRAVLDAPAGSHRLYVHTPRGLYRTVTVDSLDGALLCVTDTRVGAEAVPGEAP